MSESPPFLEEIPGRNKATSGSDYAERMLLENNEFWNIFSVCKAHTQPFLAEFAWYTPYKLKKPAL
jgi:hypothetical protein